MADQSPLDRLRNGSALFLDGRNEHGTHVLSCYPTGISHNDLDETLVEQGEMILQAAESLGYAVGDMVWGRFSWVEPEYHEERVAHAGYWDFAEIDVMLTQQLSGGGG